MRGDLCSRLFLLLIFSPRQELPKLPKQLEKNDMKAGTTESRNKWKAGTESRNDGMTGRTI
jgi:hypothetical protein